MKSDNGQSYMSNEWIYHVFVTLKKMFPHLMKIKWIPFYHNHGRCDTDRFFGVIECMIGRWVKQYRLDSTTDVVTC